MGWEDVTNLLDVHSDCSEACNGWTVADEVMSACGSEATEFDVASTCGRMVSSARPRPSAALKQVAFTRKPHVHRTIHHEVDSLARMSASTRAYVTPIYKGTCAR